MAPPALGGGDLTQVAPGQCAVLRFKATKSGVFVYHFYLPRGTDGSYKRYASPAAGFADMLAPNERGACAARDRMELRIPALE